MIFFQEKVAQTACMSACRHISARLTELILDPDVKTVTMAALQQFNLDVIQCEGKCKTIVIMYVTVF